MNKPTILVDMDGVFCNFVEGYYAILEQKYGFARQLFPNPAELKTFYIADSITHPMGKAVEKNICNDPELFSSLKPLQGAIAGMRELLAQAIAADCNVYICTAPHLTNPSCYTQKAKWVEQYLGFEWLELLIITRDKTMVIGDVLLDDKPEPLGNNIPTWEHVLFTCSYNDDIIGKQRINNWSTEAINLLISTAQRNFKNRK